MLVRLGSWLPPSSGRCQEITPCEPLCSASIALYPRVVSRTRRLPPDDVPDSRCQLTLSINLTGTTGASMCGSSSETYISPLACCIAYVQCGNGTDRWPRPLPIMSWHVPGTLIYLMPSGCPLSCLAARNRLYNLTHLQKIGRGTDQADQRTEIKYGY